MGSNVSGIRTRDWFERSWSIQMAQPSLAREKKGGLLAAFKNQNIPCGLVDR
jgi:hypothetical protein